MAEALATRGELAVARSPRRDLGRSSGFLLVAALLVIWEAVVRLGIVTSVNLPPFSEVAQRLVAGLLSGELLRVIGPTLRVTFEGFALGCLIAIPTGLSIAVSSWCRRLVQPTVDLLQPIPIPAILPPLIFLLGLGDAIKVFSIAFATFFPVVLSTTAGALAVDPVHRQVIRTFGVPRATALFKVLIPSSMPYVLTGVRTGLGLALIVAVVAEMIIGEGGVGDYLVAMQFALRAADMYAAIVLLTALAYGLNRAILAWERRAIRWSRLRDAT